MRKERKEKILIRYDNADETLFVLLLLLLLILLLFTTLGVIDCSAQQFAFFPGPSRSRSSSSSSTSSQSQWHTVANSSVLLSSSLRTPRDIKKVIHFIGGAFVGASPQLSYRLFLEKLSEMSGDCIIIATPYNLQFDQLRCADDAQFQYDLAMRQLSFGQESSLPKKWLAPLGRRSSSKSKSGKSKGNSTTQYDTTTTTNNSNKDYIESVREEELPMDWLQRVPTYGIGHSLGSLLHLFIGARYIHSNTNTNKTTTTFINDNNSNSNYNTYNRQGNVLLSFNNKSASDAVPVFSSPIFAPFTQSAAGSIESFLNQSIVQVPLQMVSETIRNTNSNSNNNNNDSNNENGIDIDNVIKQALPLIEQVSPLLSEVREKSGNLEFIPTPVEAKRLIGKYYGIQNNLLIKFQDDSIDETPELAELLLKREQKKKTSNNNNSNDANTSQLDLSLKILSGDHVRPLKQTIALPEELLTNNNNMNDNSNNNSMMLQVPDEIVTAAETGTEILNSLVSIADEVMGVDNTSNNTNNNNTSLSGFNSLLTAPLRDIASISSEVSSSLRSTRNNSNYSTVDNENSNSNNTGTSTTTNANASANTNSSGFGSGFVDLNAENEKDIEELVKVIVDWMN